jgi:L-alanine-DL-glutamate epimerase-like enolase superfamily enzyme
MQMAAAAGGAAASRRLLGAHFEDPARQARIARVESFAVSYPVVGHFKFLAGRDGRPPGRDAVIVKLTDEEGRTGWGESIPSHTWSYETLETVQSTIDRYLGPALIGQDVFDSDGMQAVMDRTIAPSFSRGQPICKAGIDLAAFDLRGQILQQPAASQWKRKTRNTITLSWTLNPRTLEEIPGLIEQGQAKGFHHFNVKVGGGADFDVAMCREIRRLAPDAFVWVDANGGYDLDTALTVAPRFADCGIAGFEQPLPANRLSWYRRLMRQKALPVLMDEPIVTLVDLEEFHRLGLLDGVAMKLSRCGGLTESCRILQYMEDHGLLFFASGLTDPELSLAASISLFAAYQLERPAALNAPQFLTGSVLKQPLQIVGDQAHVPTGPGLGVEVDEAKLRKLMI